MGTQERMCGLCLKICDDFKAVEGHMKDVLDVVLPKMDLAVIQNFVICTDCTKKLLKCFDFKAACFYTYDSLIPFVNDKDVKLDLKDVLLRNNENDTGVPEDQKICGFCMDPVNNCSAISLDVEEGGILMKMIEKCLPELDINIINKPVICAPCRCSLEECCHFVTNYLTVEEKIKKECEAPDIDSKDLLELSSLLLTTTRHGAINEVDTVKVEKQYCEQRENADEGETCSKSAIVKLEPMICDEGHLADMENQEFLVSEKIEIKTDPEECNRFEGAVLLPQSKVATGLHRRQNCVVPNLDGDISNPYVKHTSTNENVTKIRMFKCDYCSFQTKSNHYLKSHLQKHKDPPKVIMYKCDKCDYCSFRYIKSHLQKNKNRSEVTINKCDYCSFQARQKSKLESRLLIHKSPSEVTVYKCDSCSFQTKRKGYFDRHLLVHKREVTVYKCDSCSFQTRHKSVLKTHQLVHKSLSEITVYKCGSCLFQTKHKGSFAGHLLIHKNPSEVAMYKCDCCSYQTRQKGYLKRHLLVHKSPSEITMYKCASCSFQARRKSTLIAHLLVHKSPSEVTMYKCDSCSFQAKYNKVLKTHLLVHKSPSEVTMYKCDSCSYQTKLKSNYKKHLLVHRSLSEITVYKCDLCSFQTKHNKCLKRHLKVHKN